MTDPGAVALEPVLEAAKPWLSRPNIVGLGIGSKITGGRDTGEPAVLVFVERKQPAAEADFVVPATLSADRLAADGTLSPVEVRTDVQETGPIQTHVLNQRVRPVPGGYQIEAANIGGTGTLGVNIVWATKYRAMTNNHVLASNGNLGAPVYQPDKANDNAIGTVSGYVPVVTYADGSQPNPHYNVQDLAWVDISPATGDPEIHRIGRPSGMRAPRPGEEIEMIGKTSGVVQRSRIADIASKARLNWAPGTAKPYAWFERLVRLEDPLSRPGDSGAAYVATSDKAVVAINIGGSGAFSYGCQLWPY